jgi:hypothetical protein
VAATNNGVEGWGWVKKVKRTPLPDDVAAAAAIEEWDV